MPEVAISALTAATGLTDDDVLIVNDGATTKKITVANAAGGLSGDMPTFRTGATEYATFPGYSMGGAKYTGGAFNPPSGEIRYTPIYCTGVMNIDTIVLQVLTAAAASSVGRVGIYNADVDFQPTDLIVESATFGIDTTGVKDVAITATSLSPGSYMIGYWGNGQPVLAAWEGTNFMVGSANFSSTSFVYGYRVSSTYSGTGLPDPGTAWTTTSATTAQTYPLFGVKGVAA